MRAAQAVRLRPQRPDARVTLRSTAMNAVVRWPPKVRALAALFVPAMAWLAYYAFTAEQAPSPPAGVAAIGMGVLALVFQLHLARFRVEAGEAGIVVTTLRGVRRIPWSEVQKVEAIGRSQEGSTTVRFATAPELAFDLVVHTRQGRVAVNRWMTGMDAFVAELGVRRGGDYRTPETSALEKDDPTVTPALRPQPVLETTTRVVSAITTGAVVVLVAFMSLCLGFVGAAVGSFRVTGDFVLDGALGALAPFGVAALVHRLVVRARAKRFGPGLARWHMKVKDACLTVFAAFAGPLLLYGFVPQLPHAEPAIFVAVAMGVWLTWVPVAEIRKALAAP